MVASGSWLLLFRLLPATSSSRGWVFFRSPRYSLSAQLKGGLHFHKHGPTLPRLMFTSEHLLSRPRVQSQQWRWAKAGPIQGAQACIAQIRKGDAQWYDSVTNGKGSSPWTVLRNHHFYNPKDSHWLVLVHRGVRATAHPVLANPPSMPLLPSSLCFLGLHFLSRMQHIPCPLGSTT